MNKRRVSTKGGPAKPAPGPVMQSLVHAARAVENRVEDVLQAVGLSAPKFAALTHLVHAGEALSLSECASKMTCVRSNITQLMDRLEAEGLVRRVDHPNDRRGVLAELTALGRERQAAGARAVEKVESEFARALAAVDQGALLRVLSAMTR
jgi:DNA-binding MarR family transcriptional regulator